MSRSTFVAQIVAIIASQYAGKESTVITRTNTADEDCYAAECFSDSQKPAPHSMTRRQYKTLVLPRRSRKSKRR